MPARRRRQLIHRLTNGELAIGIAIPFLLHWGYFTLFEAFWNGQTPGKRLMKLRVIQQSGRALGLFESMGRNLIRFIDMLPIFYFIGAICVFLEHAASSVWGTWRRKRRWCTAPPSIHPSSLPAVAAPLPPPSFERPLGRSANLQRSSGLQLDAVSRLNKEDLQMIDNFLARRLDLPTGRQAHPRTKIIPAHGGKDGSRRSRWHERRNIPRISRCRPPRTRHHPLILLNHRLGPPGGIPTTIYLRDLPSRRKSLAPEKTTAVNTISRASPFGRGLEDELRGQLQILALCAAVAVRNVEVEQLSAP